MNQLLHDLYNSLCKKRLLDRQMMVRPITRVTIKGDEAIEMRDLSPKSVSPSVTIRVSGSLSQGHLAYLDQFVDSAIDCGLWPLLDVAYLEELDHDALGYLMGGEGRHFGIVGCPNFIREWMQHEKERFAA